MPRKKSERPDPSCLNSLESRIEPVSKESPVAPKAVKKPRGAKPPQPARTKSKSVTHRHTKTELTLDRASDPFKRRLYQSRRRSRRHRPPRVFPYYTRRPSTRLSDEDWVRAEREFWSRLRYMPSFSALATERSRTFRKLCRADIRKRLPARQTQALARKSTPLNPDRREGT